MLAGLVAIAVAHAISIERQSASWAWLAAVVGGCLLVPVARSVLMDVGPALRRGWRIPLGALAATGAAWVVAVLVAYRVDPRPSSGVGEQLRFALSLGWINGNGPPEVDIPVVGLVPIVAFGIAVLRYRRSAPDALRATASSPLVATAAAAALIGGLPVATFVGSRYVERRSDRFLYDGPTAPLILWTSLLLTAVVIVIVQLVRLVVPAWRRFLSERGRWLLTLATVWSGGLLIRVISLSTVAPARTDGGDPLYYHTQANTIARGIGFVEPLAWIARGDRIPTALHGPGYPLYLSIFSRLGASSWYDHRIASALIGSVTVVLVMIIARRLAGRAAAVVAGVFAAVYPNLWTIDGVFFPEGIFVVLCAATTIFGYRWIDHRRMWDAAGMGACIGVAALARGEGLFLLAVLVAPLVLLSRDLTWRRRLVALVVAGGAALASVGPWTVRNMAQFEVFVVLSTNGDELHVYSNCEDTYEGKFLGFWLFDCQERLRDPNGDGVEELIPPGDEAEKAKYWREVGLTYASEHRSELPKVVAARVLRQWDLFRPIQNTKLAFIEGRSERWAQVGLAGYYLLAAASVQGIRVLRRTGQRLLPLLAHPIGVTLTAAYAYGTTRFRAPAEMVVCVLAGVACAGLARRLLAWSAAPTGAAGRPAPTHGAGQQSSGWLSRSLSWPPLTRIRLAAASAAPYGPAAAVFAIATPGLFRHPGAPMEEGFMLVFPELVAKGWTPNVDFLHLYGPGSLHVLTAVYELFGNSLAVQRVVGLGYQMAIVAALIRLASVYGRRTQAVVGGLATVVTLAPIGLTALAWPGAVALALWSVVVARDRRRRWVLRSAILAGLALSFRPDLVTVVAAAHGVLWWLRRSEAARADNGLASAPSPWLRTALVGFAVGLLPVWWHLLDAGPTAALRGMFIEPVFDLRDGRSLPRPPRWDQVDGTLQFIAEHPAPWWPIPSLTAAQQIVVWFWLLIVGALASVVVGWRWHRRQPSAGSSTLLVCGAINVMLLSQALQRPDSAHLGWGSVVAAPMACCWLVEWWERRRDSGGATPSRRRTAALLLAPTVAVALVLPFFTFRTITMHARQTVGERFGGLPPGLEVQRDGRSYLLGDPAPWRAATDVIAELDRLATPGESLLVGPIDLRQTVYSDVYFYHLFPDLVPATPYIEMDPGLANGPDSQLADDVANADWLLLTRFWAGWIEPNGSIDFGSDEPNVVVEEQFCLVGSYGNDLARLYRACPEGGAPGPYEGPYDPAFDFAVKTRVPVPPRSDGTYPPGSPAAP
jgi:hypothetical protein